MSQSAQNPLPGTAPSTVKGGGPSYTETLEIDDIVRECLLPYLFTLASCSARIVSFTLEFNKLAIAVVIASIHLLRSALLSQRK